MRETICRCGGEVRFSTRVTELIIEHDEVRGVVTAGGEKYFGPVILATGHSARDVYRFLLSAGVTMEPKGLAVGVRLEHPQHPDRLSALSFQRRPRALFAGSRIYNADKGR